MNAPINFDETTVCRLDSQRKVVEPCSIVIFGASGDLTARKLIPALYHLFKDNQLPPAFRIVGFVDMVGFSVAGDAYTDVLVKFNPGYHSYSNAVGL